MQDADWLPFKAPLLPMIEGKKILSIGCGTGTSDLGFAGKGSLGVDCDDENIRIARERGFRVIKGMAQDVKIKEKFDVVIIIHLLEHIELRENVQKVFKLAHDACKEGGTLVVSTPYAYDTNAWTNYEHERCFTVHSLSEWVEKSGFKVIDAYSYWHIPLEPILLSRFGIGNYRCQFKRDYWLKLFSSINAVRDLWVIGKKTR